MELEQLAFRLGLALAIGFLLGLERGWHERAEGEGRRAAGLRTFSLIGLLGGILGALSLNGDRVLLAAAFVTIGAALAAFIWREGQKQHDFSATSLIAALLTLALGAYAVLGEMAAAAGAAVAATLLLAHKEILHAWLQRISWAELRSGLLLAAMTFIALPLLPNRTVDPWDSINPYELWLMTILIAGVSFAGYAAVKIAGPKRGLTLAAALGGLLSSTVVTLSLAPLAKDNKAHLRLLAGGILAASCVMLPRVLVIAGVINFRLAIEMAPMLLSATAVMGTIAVGLVRSDHQSPRRKDKGLTLANPFDLLQVLRFGALLAAVMLAVALVRRSFGDQGVLWLAFLSGFADVDAITLTVARLGDAPTVASQAILLTVATNSVMKAIYAGVTGNIRLGLMVLAGTAAAAVPAFVLWRAL